MYSFLVLKPSLRLLLISSTSLLASVKYSGFHGNKRRWKARIPILILSCNYIWKKPDPRSLHLSHPTLQVPSKLTEGPLDQDFTETKGGQPPRLPYAVQSPQATMNSGIWWSLRHFRFHLCSLYRTGGRDMHSWTYAPQGCCLFETSAKKALQFSNQGV